MDFPLPVGPIIASFSPGFNEKLKLLIAGRPLPFGYAKVTFLNSTSPVNYEVSTSL